MEVPTYIALIGLKMPYGDHVNAYFNSLPDTFKLSEDFTHFYRLKPKKRVATKDNLEPCYGLHYLVFSDYLNRYWYGFISEHTNMNKLLRYFNDRNLYIFKNREEFDQKEKAIDDECLII